MAHSHRLAMLIALGLLAMQAQSVGSPQSDEGRRSGELVDDPRIEKIDRFFRDKIEADAPGAAVLVVHRGEVLHRAGYGLAVVPDETPITPRSQFRLASVSKHITALCVLLLVEDGELDLDDSLRDHFEAFPEYAEDITVRHLLHHTSGLRDYMGLLASRRTPAEPLTLDIVEVLSEEKSLSFEPGQRFEYSNSGYVVLAGLVEHLSGQSLAEFARERLFEPLGMNSTHYHDDQEPPLPHRARSYRRSALGQWQDIDDHRFNVVVGDGAVYTNLMDMTRWLLALDEGTLIGEELQKLALTPGRLNDGSATTYGFGWMLGDFQGSPTIEHGGGWVGFRTYLVRIPKEQLGIVILGNFASANSGEWARQVATMVLKKG